MAEGSRVTGIKEPETVNNTNVSKVSKTSSIGVMAVSSLGDEGDAQRLEENLNLIK